MKKLSKGLAILVAIAITFSLASCAKKSAKNSGQAANAAAQTENSSQSSSEETTASETTEASTVASTAAATSAKKTAAAKSKKTAATVRKTTAKKGSPAKSISEVLNLYKNAANKTKAQKNMTVKKNETMTSPKVSSIYVNGENMTDSFNDKEFKDSMSDDLYPLSSNYNYKLNGGAYYMERTCSDGHSYYEYGGNSKFSWKNNKLVGNIKDSARGLSKSEANSELGKGEIKVSTPDWFMAISGYSDHCILTANDVKSVSYKKTGGNISVRLNLKDCTDAVAHKSGSVGRSMNPIDMSSLEGEDGIKSVHSYYKNCYISAVISPNGLIVGETLHYDLNFKIDGTDQDGNNKYDIKMSFQTSCTESYNYSNFGKTSVSKPSWA